MARRRRRPYTPPRCTHCTAPIVFFRITFSRGPVTLSFDADPFSGGEPNTYPVFAGRAWDINDLLAEIQVMRGVDVAAADTQVRGLPWHRLHRCAKGAAARLTETSEEAAR